MHPAVAAPLLYGNALPVGSAFPSGAPTAQSPAQPNPSPTYNGDIISYQNGSGPPPPYSAQPPYGPPPPYRAAVSPPSQSANKPVKTVVVTDPKVYDRERIKKALRDVLIFATVFSGSLLFLAPLALELMGTRGKAKANLLTEDFKLALRNAVRTADDLSLKWVRRWEAEHVDPLVVQRIAEYLLQDWDAFEKANEAVTSAGDNAGAALKKRRRDALQKLEDLEIPLDYPKGRTGPDPDVELSRRGLPARVSVGPKVGELITIIYHRTIGTLQERADREKIAFDGDTPRLMQFNAQRYFEASLKERSHEPIIASLRLSPTRSNARAEEYRTKLVTLHQAALRQFSEMVR